MRASRSLVGELKPVPPFDPDTLLPDVLRVWIRDEAERMPCPADSSGILQRTQPSLSGLPAVFVTASTT